MSVRLLYGRWSPLEPVAVAALLEGSGVRWWIVGGRAARVGAPARRHEDTDVAVNAADLPALRRHLAGWHLWEAHEGGCVLCSPATTSPLGGSSCGCGHPANLAGWSAAETQVETT